MIVATMKEEELIKEVLSDMTNAFRFSDSKDQKFRRMVLKSTAFPARSYCYGETWKTNANYMVNRKFIVPWICDYDTRWPSQCLKLNYGSNRNHIDDVTKALCNLVGIEYDYSQMSLYALTNTKKNWGEWYNFHFFRVKGYKKGTMHFEFLDETVWMNFNRKVAEYKGWQLPDNVRKGKK